MSDTEQHIFGYGSLINTECRATTSPNALYASPVNVAGIRRGWFGRLDDVGPTYLAAVPDANSNCNGVIFKVSAEELTAFDEFETGYNRELIDPKSVTMLDDSKPVEGDIWFYTGRAKCFASPESPILQSYVDVCLNGCLEIEARFPLAKQADFARTFLKTSTDWNQHWLNDRISPPLLFPQRTNVTRIDELIREVLGDEMCANRERK